MSKITWSSKIASYTVYNSTILTWHYSIIMMTIIIELNLMLLKLLTFLKASFLPDTFDSLVYLTKRRE